MFLKFLMEKQNEWKIECIGRFHYLEGLKMCIYWKSFKWKVKGK